MTAVPGTKVKVAFYTFAPPYPLLYDPTSAVKLVMASINAGESQGLGVGGGGVNKQFSLDLKSAGQTNISSGKDDYADRHLKLLAKAASTGTAYEAYQTPDPSAFSHVEASQVKQVNGYYEGVCFVDVFSPKLCPAANPLNAAMVYAAPPYGDNYSDETAFLAAVQATAVTIMKAIAGYNAIAPANNQPPIQAVRNTLYSSSIYNMSPPNEVSHDKIARAIFAGFQSELQVEDGGLMELQFPVSDPLFWAIQDDLK
jgi:hypothetical protein